MTLRKPRRRIVFRGRRRYAVCGTRPSSATVARERTGGRLFLLPGITLLAVVLFSAYVIGRPPKPGAEGDARAATSIARYSFDDLATGRR